MWTPCRVMHVLYVCSAKGSTSFIIPVKDKLCSCFFFACVFAVAGCTGISYTGDGVKHQAVQCFGGVVWFV